MTTRTPTVARPSWLVRAFRRFILHHELTLLEQDMEYEQAMLLMAPQRVKDLQRALELKRVELALLQE